MSITTTTSLGMALGTRPTGTPILPTLVGTIKVMVLGDSIGVGYGSVPGDSFRCELVRLATSYGLTLDMIGARSSGSCVDIDHNCVAGWTIEQQNADASLRFGVLPDVMIIHLGTNNFIAGNSGLVAMGAYLTTLFGLSPLSRILVCVPHGSTVVAQDALARTFEAGIDAAVAASDYGVAGLALVVPQTAKLVHPVNGVLTAQGVLYDYVHPINPVAFRQLADAIFPAFLNATGRDAAWVL